MKKLIFNFFLLFFLSFSVFSQNITSLKADKEKLLSDIEELARNLESKKASRENSLVQLSLYDKEASIRENLIAELTGELKEIEQNISENDAKINQLEHDLEIIKKEYSTLILDTYKRRNALNELSFFLSSTSLAESYQRYRLLKEYSRYRQNQGLIIVESQQKLIALIQHVKMQKVQKESRLEEIQDEYIKLTHTRNQHSDLVASLQSEEQWLRKTLKDKENLAKKLENQILEYIKLAESGSVGTDFEKYKGKLIWPVTKGVVVNVFGEHAHPVLKNVSIKNNGVDIQSISDDKVFSVFNGEVSRIVAIPGYNTTIILRHGNYLSVYANVSNVTVKQGQRVLSGDLIGSVFKENSEDNGTLHFEIWQQNNKLNPLDWLVQ